jgi:hypothetical protein
LILKPHSFPLSKPKCFGLWFCQSLAPSRRNSTSNPMAPTSASGLAS